MILTQDNEYAVVLDACVLVAMPLCDTLLRFAEEPPMYRPLWSDKILQEVGDVLEHKFGYTSRQRDRRINAMSAAFPEARIIIPFRLPAALDGIPDENDRHVVAAAICGHANAIVTENTKHFPAERLGAFDVVCQSPDDFLIHQFHLNPLQSLEKLDAQAAGIREGRPEIIERLRKMAPGFVALVEKWATN